MHPQYSSISHITIFLHLSHQAWTHSIWHLYQCQTRGIVGDRTSGLTGFHLESFSQQQQWHPSPKKEKLSRKFNGNASMMYSDCKIVKTIIKQTRIWISLSLQTISHFSIISVMVQKIYFL